MKSVFMKFNIICADFIKANERHSEYKNATPS